MADEKNDVRYDVDGFDVVTTALRELVNQYPGLDDDDEIAFAVLGEDDGKAMFPVNGAVIEEEKHSVTGRVRQMCLYPFCVIYRAAGMSENSKARVKEWLDNLGRWLEKQPVTIGGETHKLSAYPALTGGRKFFAITRQTPGHLDSVEENNAENWAVYISARYQNEFQR